MHFSDWNIQTTHLQLKDLSLWIWTPGPKRWWYNESFYNLFNDLIVIIRQNHRGSSSDPILSSGCSCVKPMLPLLASNVASDVVFTSKKEWCFGLRYHRMVGCVFPLFLCFSFFTIFHIGQRCRVLCVAMVFPKGVQLQLDGLRMVKVCWEPKDVWEQSVWVLPAKARFEC